MRKKLLYTILALLILIGGFLAWQWYGHYQRTKDWKTYRNDEYGFEFKYPVKYSVKSEVLAGDNKSVSIDVFDDRSGFFWLDISKDRPVDFDAISGTPIFVGWHLANSFISNGVGGGWEEVVLNRNDIHFTFSGKTRINDSFGPNRDILQSFHFLR